MKKINDLLIRIVTGFIPLSKLRKQIRSKFTSILGSKDNYVFLIGNDNNKKRIYHGINGLEIIFKGQNNTIEIYENSTFNSTVALFQGDNSHLRIGKNFFTNGVEFNLMESNSRIEIGNDCMFSWGIAMWAADAHAIMKKGENKAYNVPKPIIIGNNVWLGYNATIGKGTVISDNSIVGMCSLVIGKFTEPNVIIAGNPARIIKRDIDWSRQFTHQYNTLAEQQSLV